MNERPFLHRPKDQDRLVYIHSNRFTTANLFQRKFLPDCTMRRAWKVLETYVDRGFLRRLKLHHRAPSVYSLTEGAIHALMDRGRILARRPQPIHFCPNNFYRDEAIQAVRLALEKSPIFEDIWWVSGYELSLGITREVKAAFQKRTLDVGAWRRTPRPDLKRYPDAYFEANVDGKRGSMALVYMPGRVGARALEWLRRVMEGHYSFAWIKLVVCQSPWVVTSLCRRLARHASYREKQRWFLADLETATKQEFSQGWVSPE